MKISKIKNKLLFIIFFLAIFIGIVAVLIKNYETNNGIYGINAIDGIIFGDLSNSSLSVIKDESFFITEKSNEGKNYGKVFQQIKDFYLLLVADQEKRFVLDNQVNFGLDFSLKRILDDEIYLQAIYNTDKEQLDFVIPAERFLLNNEFLAREVVIYSLKDIKNDSVLKINNTVIDIQKFENDFFIEKKELSLSKIELFNRSNINLLDEESINFDNGLWTDRVYDCSSGLDGEPEIFMTLNENENNSLELASKNHYACAVKSFPIKIEKDKLYKFSFDYKNVKGNKAQYYYLLSDGKKSVSRTEVIASNNNAWNTYSYFIKPTFDSNNIQIFLYAPSDGTQEIINLYNNLSIEEYRLGERVELIKDIAIEKDITISDNVKLVEGRNELKYISEDKNLLDNQNSSFENGLWTKKVEDCCNSKKGEAQITMDLDSDASDGRSSLLLSSKNHCAGSNKAFSVSLSNDKLYRFSFDYKNLKGGKIQYYYALRNKDNLSERNSNIIEVDNSNWNHFEKIIDTRLTDVNFFDVYFYASSDGKQEVENLYDNVKLEEYSLKNMDSYYLFASQSVNRSTKFNAVEYKSINLFKSLVILHGVNKSFLLSFPAKYTETLKAYPYKNKGYLPLGIAGLKVPAGYFVPDTEAYRQASKEELDEYIASSNISATGPEFISKKVDGSIKNDNLKNPPAFATYLNQALDDNIHYQINNYGNAWWINLYDICVFKDLCYKNSDGTYDISLIIEYDFNKLFNILLFFWGIISFCYLIYWGNLSMKSNLKLNKKKLWKPCMAKKK